MVRCLIFKQWQLAQCFCFKSHDLDFVSVKLNAFWPFFLLSRANYTLWNPQISGKRKNINRFLISAFTWCKFLGSRQNIRLTPWNPGIVPFISSELVPESYYVMQLNVILQEVDPCEDLSDDDIRTAIQNATGPKSALFVPEVGLCTPLFYWY